MRKVVIDLDNDDIQYLRDTRHTIRRVQDILEPISTNTSLADIESMKFLQQLIDQMLGITTR